jgi:polyisoprenoid-binding protein YceI
MYRPRLTILGTCALALALGAGCSNPADNKTEAVVEDAKPIPRPANTGERYIVGEGSSLEFTGSKVTGSHDGGFHDFSGEIMLVDGDPASSTVEIDIDVNSMWTDSDKLTGHLKSPDFFGAERYPKSTFRSTKVALEGDHYTITGNLQLHGVVRSISFPATITVEEGRVTANAEFFIKRFDFKIEYTGKADDLIRDEVVIKLNLVAEREATT